jgi:hypothetical protein
MHECLGLRVCLQVPVDIREGLTDAQALQVVEGLKVRTNGSNDVHVLLLAACTTLCSETATPVRLCGSMHRRPCELGIFSSSSFLHFQLRPACGLHEYTSQAALEHTQANWAFDAILCKLAICTALTPHPQMGLAHSKEQVDARILQCGIAAQHLQRFRGVHSSFLRQVTGDKAAAAKQIRALYDLFIKADCTMVEVRGMQLNK